jgi:hypothetical protein
MTAQSDMLQVTDYTHISHLDWQPSPPRDVVACAANDPQRSNDHTYRHSAAEGRGSLRRQRPTDKQRPYMSSSRLISSEHRPGYPNRSPYTTARKLCVQTLIYLYGATLMGEYEQLYPRIKSSPLSHIVWKQIYDNSEGRAPGELFLTSVLFSEGHAPGELFWTSVLSEGRAPGELILTSFTGRCSGQRSEGRAPGELFWTSDFGRCFRTCIICSALPSVLASKYFVRKSPLCSAEGVYIKVATPNPGGGGSA